MGEDSSMHDDDDMECLPDIFENISGRHAEEKQFEVAQGDIVWAEFRELYWPALVRHVFKKEKKVSIWYLDSPKKCFKLPLKRIKNFKCAKISEQIRKEAGMSNVKDMHDSTMFRTLDYIRRKANGENNDPAKFFDLSCPYLVLSRCALDAEEAKDDTSSTEEESTFRDESEEDPTFEEEPEEEIDDYLSKKSEADENNLNESANEESKAIVSYVTSGKTDKFLLKVRSRRVSSNWQKLYDETENKKMLMFQVRYTPISSFEALREMATHLVNLFERDVGGHKDEMVAYVTSVWLPEAIENALLFLNGGSPENEEKINSTPPDRIPKASTKSAKSTRKRNKCRKSKDKNLLPKQAKRKLQFEENSISEPPEADKLIVKDNSCNSEETSEMLHENDNMNEGAKMKSNSNKRTPVKSKPSTSNATEEKISSGRSKKKTPVKSKPSTQSANEEKISSGRTLRNRVRISYAEY